MTTRRNRGRPLHAESPASPCEALETRRLLAAVNPYLQNPASDAMTIIWFTQTNTPGTLSLLTPATRSPITAPALPAAISTPLLRLKKRDE